MKTKLFFTFLFLSLNIGLSQEELIFMNAQPIDAERYKGIKGSPYLFEDWSTGVLLRDNEKPIEVPEMNFNAYSHNFEVKTEDKIIILDGTPYKAIKIKGIEEEKPTLFARGVHPYFKGKFVIVLYEGQKRSLFKQYSNRIYENTIQDVGKTREIKRFTASKNYFILENGELKKVKLKKKDVLAILGVEKVMKQNKIKMNSEEDLVRLLELIE